MNNTWKKQDERIDQIVERLAYELDPNGEYSEEGFKRDTKVKIKAHKAILKEIKKAEERGYERGRSDCPCLDKHKKDS